MEVLQIFALPLVYHGSVVQYRKTKDRIQRDKGQNTKCILHVTRFNTLGIAGFIKNGL